MIAPFWSATNDPPIDWYAFLGRTRLPAPTAALLDPLRRASILVTGAAGSIGGALSLRLAALGPKELVLLDSSEQALHRLQSALGDVETGRRPRLVLGNCGDAALLAGIFDRHGPRIIFHAAAYKHVPMLEQHPLEAIANNALNTFTLAECAFRANGTRETRLLLLSTDKAVEPISILGATKRIAELITVAHRGVVLRLGNVLGTEGSVSETFLRQITGGGPITITDRDAQRYFLTCEEAVDLLLASSIQVTDGAILVPGLERQYSIASLADFHLAAKGHVRAIPVEQIGMRSGDKPFEKLWSGEEEPISVEDRGYLELNRSNSYAYRENLATSLAMLKTATIKRDLVAAMGIVSNLVPEYEPSARMLALLQSSSLEARALRGLQV